MIVNKVSDFFGVFNESNLLSMHRTEECANKWIITKCGGDGENVDTGTIHCESSMTLEEKMHLAKQIRDYSADEIAVDFNKLRAIGKKAGEQSPRTKVGNKVVDAFTFMERLNTVSYKGKDMSFYFFWKNREKYESRENIQKFMEYQKKDRNPDKIHAMWYNVYRLYYGSIHIFKPLFAMEHYCKYNSRVAIMDITMGWGGRMVGACALDMPKYIGVDVNQNLRPLLSSMADFLRERSKTEIELYFQDARTIDYSSMKYDMVFTSPPYYNLEIYNGVKTWSSKKEWDEEFYWPILWLSYEGLMSGGHFCINVNQEIYDRACVPLLGEAHEKYEFYRECRNVRRNPEYVYIWHKL